MPTTTSTNTITVPLSLFNSIFDHRIAGAASSGWGAIQYSTKIVIFNDNPQFPDGHKPVVYKAGFPKNYIIEEVIIAQGDNKRIANLEVIYTNPIGNQSIGNEIFKL